MILGQLHAPCAVCGISSSDGLFPPAPAGNDAYRPVAARVPLCHDHKMQFLRGELAFPQWCDACDAYRPDDHSHPVRRRNGRAVRTG